MKRSFFSALLLVLSLISWGASASGSAIPFRLEISGPAVSVKSGGQIKIQVSFHNISGQPIEFYKVVGLNAGDYEYSIKILRDGVESTKTAYGTDLSQDTGTVNRLTRALISVEPNQSVTETINANNIYDMSVPGTYDVTVLKYYPDGTYTPGLQGEFVPSNTIAVTVVP